MKLPYRLKKELLYFVLGGFGGGSLIGLILWMIFSCLKIKIDFASLATSFAGAVVSVTLIIASVMVFLAQASPRVFQKRGVTPFLYPLILLLLAVFLSIAAYVSDLVFYWSVSFLVIGVLFFFNELKAVILEETFGATLKERITYESREKKEPVLNEPSPIGKDVFKDKIHINKGDAILALCDSIEEGRRLASEIIRTGNYGIYITADRPWTIIREDFKNYKKNLYCIDCFTNFYGLDEFKGAERCLFSVDMDAGLEGELNKINGSHSIPIGLRYKFKTKECSLSENATNATISKEEDNKWVITDKREIIYILRKEEEKLNIYIYTENFYPYTPRPVTIRKLHGELRDIRKRTVSKILYNKDWSQLKRKQKKEVKGELASRKAENERKENVRIIYDSVSSLSSIFDIEDLLKFLIHDTNVDKTIGRNTLLLVKKGILDDSIIKKLESFCEICLNPKVINGKTYIHINKVRDENPPDDFSIDC